MTEGEDTSWLYDMRLEAKSGAIYAFDEKALEIDEGYLGRYCTSRTQAPELCYD